MRTSTAGTLNSCGMLRKMKAIREGEGTLLDNCMVLFGSISPTATVAVDVFLSSGRSRRRHSRIRSAHRFQRQRAALQSLLHAGPWGGNRTVRRQHAAVVTHGRHLFTDRSPLLSSAARRQCGRSADCCRRFQTGNQRLFTLAGRIQSQSERPELPSEFPAVQKPEMMRTGAGFQLRRKRPASLEQAGSSHFEQSTIRVRRPTLRSRSEFQYSSISRIVSAVGW